MRRHKRAHIAPQSRYLLHHSRTEKRVSVLRHHENRFHSLIQLTIHQGQLKFKFKVRNSPQSTHNGLRGALVHVVHQQALERIRLHVRQVPDRIAHQLQSFFQCEQGLFALVPRHRHNHAIEQFGRAFDHIQVAVGEWIKTAGINRRAHGKQLTTWTLPDEEENYARWPAGVIEGGQ